MGRDGGSAKHLSAARDCQPLWTGSCGKRRVAFSLLSIPNAAWAAQSCFTWPFRTQQQVQRETPLGAAKGYRTQGGIDSSADIS